MYTRPMILPLDADGRIYELQDEHGETIGTGSREVCEILLYLITQPSGLLRSSKQRDADIQPRARQS